MAVNANEDTEFNDALRAHGILPPKAPSRSPSPELPSASEQRAADLSSATLGDINRALEADGLDGAGEEEERLLLHLRRERMMALAKENRKARFGRVYPITRPDYTREVTEASKADPDRVAGEDEDDEEEDVETGAGTKTAPSQGKKKGTPVVCFLYKDAMETCRLLSGYLDRLAAKYPSTKFVSIVGDKCIENYPDRNLPTLLCYRNGELHRQIIGLRPEIGLSGMDTKLEDIELLLTAVGMLDRSSIPRSATNGSAGGGGQGDEENEDEDQDENEGFGGARRPKGQSLSQSQSESQRRGQPTIMTQEEEDELFDL